MPKIDLPPTPQLDQPALAFHLQQGLGARYKVEDAGGFSGVTVQGDGWPLVRIKVKHSDKRTRIVANRHFDYKALALLVPLVVLAVLPGVIMMLVLTGKAKPIETDVMAFLESARPQLTAGAPGR